MRKKLFVSFLLLTIFYFAKGQNGTVGEKVYKTKCLVCHQADGGGVPNLNAPLDGATNVVGNDIARLVKIIRYGYNERIALDGFYYSNAMPANADLTSTQIAAVLTYIRKSWSNQAAEVTVAQVQKHLKKR
jgi:mono/diheme cytochrome c family protein